MADGTRRAAIIDVVRVSEDGWETFTSPQIPGLYMVVESSDLEGAYDDLPRAIELLILNDTGKTVSVRAENTFGDYLKSQAAPGRSIIRHYSIEPVAA